MAKIKNLKVYPIKQNPTDSDFVIGTCAETGKTYNFRISDILKLSKCCDDDANNTNPDNFEFYSFQFDSLTNSISNTSLLTDSFLLDNGLKHTEDEILKGENFTFSKVGRYGFVVKDAKNNPYKIFDILNNEVTNDAFDTLYDSINSVFYYVSKEYVAPSVLYYKFVKQ